MTWFIGFGIIALGCQQILAIEGDVVVLARDAGIESAAPSCGGAIADTACGACVSAKCCPEMTACSATQGCGSFESCLLGCGPDYACRARCDDAYPGGGNFRGVPPLDVCVTSNCERECGLSCGVVVANAGMDAAVGCQACIAANNCAAAEACARSLDCSEVAQCTGICTTADCKQACGAGHDAGAALLQSFLAPLEGACLTACAYGQTWSCVSKVALPAANGASTVVTLTVITLEGVVVPGLTVKACAIMDLACSAPIDVQTTDANGVATLTVRGGPVGFGFDGYFDVARGEDADASATQAAIVPSLFFPTYPFSEPVAQVSALALTPSDLAAFAAAGGVSPVDGGADLILGAVDCKLELASGVTFAAATSTGLDLGSRLRYVAGMTPDPSATATGTTGVAFLFGVPALEDIAVTMTPTTLGREAGTVHAFARAGGIAVVPVVPR